MPSFVAVTPLVNIECRSNDSAVAGVVPGGGPSLRVISRLDLRAWVAMWFEEGEVTPDFRALRGRNGRGASLLARAREELLAAAVLGAAVDEVDGG
jgi:hypothetical protein